MDRSGSGPFSDVLTLAVGFEKKGSAHHVDVRHLQEDDSSYRAAGCDAKVYGRTTATSNRTCSGQVSLNGAYITPACCRGPCSCSHSWAPPTPTPKNSRKAESHSLALRRKGGPRISS